MKQNIVLLYEIVEIIVSIIVLFMELKQEVLEILTLKNWTRAFHRTRCCVTCTPHFESSPDE